jgi:hypothetical protein
MLILQVVELTEKYFWYMSFSWILSCLLVFSQTISVAQSTIEAEYVAVAPKFFR